MPVTKRLSQIRKASFQRTLPVLGLHGQKKEVRTVKQERRADFLYGIIIHLYFYLDNNARTLQLHSTKTRRRIQRMKKRILSMLLALALTLGLFPAAARAEEASVASITVQLTLYEKGQFAKDKDGRIMFQRSVTVTDDNGDGTYSLNEALLAAHTAYCSAGADGYTVSGSWVTQLWGTATSDYGFYKNNAVTGTVDAEALADGDQITAFTYYDTAGYSDRYSFFTEAEKTVTAGEEFTLTLMSWGYDGNFNPVQAPVAAAPIGAYDLDTGTYSVPSAFRGEHIYGDIYSQTVSTSTSGSVTFSITELGTYYVTAQHNSPGYSTYNDDGSTSPNYLVPPMCKVTVTSAQSAPRSITIVSDNGNPMLGGSLIGKTGDTFSFKALDQDGNETPVTWKKTYSYVDGSIDANTGVYTAGSVSAGSSSSLYFTATSTLDSNISAQITLSLKGYAFSSYQKEQSVALSADGQTAQSISVSGGVSGHTVWSYDETAAAGIAALAADPGSGTSIKFNALRPGRFTVSFYLEGYPSMSDTAALTITGVAVEDAAGSQGKTYLTRTAAQPSPTAQLTAYVAEDRTVAGWSSADESIATVDENGLVTAKGVGSVLITATDSAGTRGGIKVVVQDGETPYFEALEFSTSALTSGSWTTGSTFSPTKLEYGLPIRSYSTSSLTLQAATLYNSDKYIATAEYTDANGAPQCVTVNSGKMTTLPNQPFDDSSLTITLADRANPDNKTVYTFHVARPRDTSKAIKSNGIVLAPDGRSLLSTKYNGYTEGTMLKADESGALTSGTGVTSTQKYYRVYALDSLERFSLTLTPSTGYAHMRYSTDNGATWTELPQGGGATGTLSFPAAGDKVVQVRIEILDDKTYSDNSKAGKSGFASGEPEVYTVWVEQADASAGSARILTASSVVGDWYPAFDPEITSYNLVVPNDTTNLPTILYTVSEGAVVKLGSAVQAPDENGVYSLPLKTTSQSLTITSAAGSVINTYSFKALKKSKYDVPDKVVDYLCINSQYTNGGYGVQPELTLSGSLKSLGNFGGYITYYYETPLTDSPNNKYGLDFYVYGNSFADGGSTAEPGQVWVSEDGGTWYALAGSEHYEDSTIRDYTITYTRTDSGKTAWSDNQGNYNDGTSRAGSWPSAANYPLNALASQGTITLSGILLPCFDGSIMGDSSTASFAGETKFGYVDYYANGTTGADVNPYVADPTKSNGFDLAWAVDADGNPIDVSGRAFHYVKVVTASNIWAGSFAEKSTEVSSVVRTTAQEGMVGTTAAPSGVTITDGTSSQVLHFTEGQQVYTMDLGDMKYISLTVEGTAADDNIYINNQRVSSGSAATGIKVTKEAGPKSVRILVQNGDREPVLYLLKLTSSAAESSEIIEGIKVDVGGAARQAATANGTTYTLTVGHRIDSVGINPTVASGVRYTVNGAAALENYALSYGENRFEISAQDQNGTTQTAALVITRESAPDVSGQAITVSFLLYGDEKHGEISMAHTYQHTKSSLQLWIPQTSYTLPEGSTVLDLLESALNAAGLDWTNAGGNYISTINGLSEFDNGPLSGWMYLRNGSHPDYGVAEQSLSNGDRIIFHYTDDYTQEEGSERWDTGESSGMDTGNGSTTLRPEAEADKNGEANVLLTAKELEQAIGQAKATDADVVVIAPAIKGNPDKVTAELPKASIAELAKNTDAELSLKTELGVLSVPTESLAGLSRLNGSTAVLSVEAGEDADGAASGPVRFEVKVGGTVLEQLEGGMRVAVPFASASSSSVLVLVEADGSETIVKKSVAGSQMVSALVDGSCTVLVRNQAKAFSDLQGHWAQDAIRFVSARELFHGTSASAFSPDAHMTRSMLATVLWRLEDAEGTSGSALFSDVPGGAWFADAVRWASGKEIVTGYGDGRFGSNDSITREQLAAILYRYCRALGVPTEPTGDLSRFHDSRHVSDWACDAMSWAVGCGLISGKSGGTLDPAGSATRAEVAAVFQRMISLLVQR